MRGVLSAGETTVTRLGKVIPKVSALSLKRRRASEKKRPWSFRSAEVTGGITKDGTILSRSAVQSGATMTYASTTCGQEKHRAITRTRSWRKRHARVRISFRTDVAQEIFRRIN